MWKTILKSVAHAAVGAGAVALASQVPTLLPVLQSHVSPWTGAVIASALSSLASAFAKQPHK